MPEKAGEEQPGTSKVRVLYRRLLLSLCKMIRRLHFGNLCFLRHLFQAAEPSDAKDESPKAVATKVDPGRRQWRSGHGRTAHESTHHGTVSIDYGRISKISFELANNGAIWLEYGR